MNGVLAAMAMLQGGDAETVGLTVMPWIKYHGWLAATATLWWVEWGREAAKVGLSVAGVHNITPILRKKQVACGAFVVILQRGHGGCAAYRCSRKAHDPEVTNHHQYTL